MGSQTSSVRMKSFDNRNRDGILYARLCYAVDDREMEREGLCQFWYDNGRFRGREFYRTGKLEGERKFYTSSGLLITYSYHKAGYDMDCDFNWKKKAEFCILKRFLRSRINVPIVNTFLISDLSLIVTN